MAAIENRIFVNNVPPAATAEDLQAHFSVFGNTVDVYLPRVFGTTRNKGIAYVTYETAEAKELSLKHPSHMINGHPVVVQVCLPKGQGKGSLPGTSVSMSGDRIFISGIPQEATQDDVQAYFAQFGGWTDIFMPKGSFTAGHKGICFISYQHQESVAEVLKTSPHLILGQQVVVDNAAPRDAAKGGGKGPGAMMAAGLQAAAASFLPGAHGYAAARPAAPAATAWSPRPAGGGWAAARPPAWNAGGQHAAPAAAPPGWGNSSYTGPPQGPPPNGAVMPGRLFLTKMSPGITKEDLTTYFQQFGTLNDVYMPIGKLIAFVGYADATIASAVVQMQNHEVKPGYYVTAEAAVGRPPLGGGGGGGKGLEKGKVRSHPYRAAW